jgi:formate hydrogenlyase subunit 4
MTLTLSLLRLLLALLLAPLLPGVINKTKAFFAGRRGSPVLQLYFDIWKLLRKGTVYSRTTSWIFRAAPLVTLASTAAILCLAPWGGLPAPIAFTGDLILLAYFLGLARLFTVIAALDTGSSFEGMGASREVFFSALAEPILLLGLTALSRVTGSFSLSSIFAGITPGVWGHTSPLFLLVAAAFAVVFLAENARIPVDDPNTHLELTMIHEVMVLDYGGPDLAFVFLGSSLKLWALGALLVGLVVPVRMGHLWIDAAAFLAGMLLLAVGVGVVESSMARLRLLRVPQMLVGAGALVVLAVLLSLR